MGENFLKGLPQSFAMNMRSSFASEQQTAQGISSTVAESSIGVFDRVIPTSAAQFRGGTGAQPTFHPLRDRRSCSVGCSMQNALLHIGFAHFQHASSDNASH